MCTEEGSCEEAARRQSITRQRERPQRANPASSLYREQGISIGAIEEYVCVHWCGWDMPEGLKESYNTKKFLIWGNLQCNLKKKAKPLIV